MPRTQRGQPIVLGGDPKGKNFLYTNGNSVIIRNIEVSQFFFILKLIGRRIEIFFTQSHLRVSTITDGNKTINLIKPFFSISGLIWKWFSRSYKFFMRLYHHCLNCKIYTVNIFTVYK